MKVACFAILLLIASAHVNDTLGNDHEYLGNKLTGLFKGIRGFLAKIHGTWAIDRREAVGRVHETNTHKMKVRMGSKERKLANKLSNEMRKPKCSKKCRQTQAEIRKMKAKPCVVKCRR